MPAWARAHARDYRVARRAPAIWRASQHLSQLAHRPQTPLQGKKRPAAADNGGAVDNSGLGGQDSDRTQGSQERRRGSPKGGSHHSDRSGGHADGQYTRRDGGERRLVFGTEEVTISRKGSTFAPQQHFEAACTLVDKDDKVVLVD